MDAMEQEHIQRPDSRLPFTTTNYGLTTWPAQVRPLPPTRQTPAVILPTCTSPRPHHTFHGLATLYHQILNRRKGRRMSAPQGQRMTRTLCWQEWRVVLERDVSFATAHRRIPDFRELLATERARRAGLKDCEVVAIVLYTGPMVCPPPIPSPHFPLSHPPLPALPTVRFPAHG
jgi:hypothetical protein